MPARGGSRARWTVFLDRDGILNRKAPEHDYIKSRDEFEWLPGAREALRRLSDAGAHLFIVTNQQGVARGVMSEADVAGVHDLVRSDLSKAGVTLDAIYVCPHLAGTCDCRKPALGLFHRARQEFPEVDFARSVVVGDSQSDIDAGRQLGARTVFVQRPGALPARGADAIASSLPDAVERWILEWI
jgi:D-glycero-D-manno-heptose 1,7-bisphosphate phosphatase